MTAQKLQKAFQGLSYTRSRDLTLQRKRKSVAVRSLHTNRGRQAKTKRDYSTQINQSTKVGYHCIDGNLIALSS